MELLQEFFQNARKSKFNKISKKKKENVSKIKGFEKKQAVAKSDPKI